MQPNIKSLYGLTIFLSATVTSAAVVKVQGTIQNVPEITTFQTWGGPNDDGALLPPLNYENNMEGIQVTVHFSAAPSETKIWTGAGIADPGGRVEGDDGDWSLQNLTPPNNHSFSSPWELEYNAGGGAKGNLVAFEIDGFGKFVNSGEIEGNTAFDTTNPSTGTPNSAQGRDFNVIGNTHGTDATYSDAIKLSAAAMPVGDLYRRLRVDFKGQVDLKWRQRPVSSLGENIHSDIDWRLAMTPNGDRQAAADDFISNGQPITGVRWWGSYFDPAEQPQPDPMNQNLVPPVEEGYVISFFQRLAGAAGPGPLLGMYTAPADAVDIQPTGLVGWDGHPVWEYVVDLDQTLLEHASAIAQPDAFLEVAETEYWISIAAENGHRIDVDNGQTIDNGDPVRTTPWWGWHTTPDMVALPAFTDNPPFAANISMDGDQWVYAPWNVAPQQHPSPNLNNLAFELLTVDASTIGLDGITDTMMSFYADTDTVVAVPEPSSFVLFAAAVLVALGQTGSDSARRRRSQWSDATLP